MSGFAYACATFICDANSSCIKVRQRDVGMVDQHCGRVGSNEYHYVVNEIWCQLEAGHGSSSIGLHHNRLWVLRRGRFFVCIQSCLFHFWKDVCIFYIEFFYICDEHFPNESFVMCLCCVMMI